MTNRYKEIFSMFARELVEQFPFFTHHLKSLARRFGEKWREEFGRELTLTFGVTREVLSSVARHYALFTLDQVRLQQEFQKDGAYQRKCHKDVYKEIYGDRKVMLNYLPACLVTTYLWPNLYEQLCFFREHFVPRLRSADDLIVYDVGFGSGFHSKELLCLIPSIRVYGIDVSASSKMFAEDLMRKWKVESRFSTELRDLQIDSCSYRSGNLISLELLEHLDHPEQFLKGIVQLLDPNGIGFISAAITAAERDHIYLYRNIGEVEDHLKKAGFTVLESQEFASVQGKGNAIVPRVGACIVCRGGA